jgi:hypothetical protein
MCHCGSMPLTLQLSETDIGNHSSCLVKFLALIPHLFFEFRVYCHNVRTFTVCCRICVTDRLFPITGPPAVYGKHWLRLHKDTYTQLI